jgi:hypothetical protein
MTAPHHQESPYPPLPTPHAFHSNLPHHHKDPLDGIPFITKFAQKRAHEVVELAMSIQLSEHLYKDPETLFNTQQDMQVDEDELLNAEGDDDDDDDLKSTTAMPETLSGLSKKCSRLHSKLIALDALKFGGISQLQLCQIVLHLLKLVTATVDENYTLHYENVGQLLLPEESEQDVNDNETLVADTPTLRMDLLRPFALHSPAREALLLVLVNILSNKGPLRSASNAAIVLDSSSPSIRLVLFWKALLRMLLHTAPYLDERCEGTTRSDSYYRQTTLLKRTVQLIRDARHFYQQPQTADAIWEMVQSDVLYHSHTHACYRGAILLYLFLPSRCSSAYYARVMPLWLESWSNMDRCHEFDFLWLALFCRARKHVHADYDWKPIRQRLLTHAQYWLQLPIGGAAMDKSFPRAANPRGRSCPPRLKAFTGASSAYEEGIDFVAKVVKLLVTGLGTGVCTAAGISEGTHDVLRFLSFVTPYLNPSNIGSWTFTLGAFLHYFAYELCCRIGSRAGVEALQTSDPGIVEALKKAQPGATSNDIPPREIVALLDALLPLCQQAIYSKNGHVGRAGESAMLYLVQIDPVWSTPAFVDFATRALDVAAVNLSHQAPAALSALTRLIQPALRTSPTGLLVRLPDILALSLAGIDSNDQNKCIRTLILYRTLTSWLPVGGNPNSWAVLEKTGCKGERNDGTRALGENLFDLLTAKRETAEYLLAIEELPATSLLKQGTLFERESAESWCLALEEASTAMGDWALELLERVFGLLRVTGEREKAGKTASGVASRHSSADVHQARNFSRVLVECLMQLFASMDDDTHALAVRAVIRFVDEETLPLAAKDASLVCQAAAAARGPGNNPRSPGLDALVPLLTDDFKRHSSKTLIYRIRCLAGAVKSAGRSLLKHRADISRTIFFALSSDDRHILKTGCKLLRHTLATLCEDYPISTDSRPRIYRCADESMILGKSAQLHGDGIDWHTPDQECVEFAAELLKCHVSARLDVLCATINTPLNENRSTLLNSTDVDLRRSLRVFRYAIRGGASILLDDMPSTINDDIVPYEMAERQLLQKLDNEVKTFLLGIRGRLCSFLIVMSSIIASDSFHPDAISKLPDDDPYRKVLPLLSADSKVCKETCDIALLLLTRRGAAFRSQEAQAIWKAQQQNSTDFTLCAQVERMAEVLQMTSLYGDCSLSSYNDGEDSGRTIPRRLLVTQVHLFHNALQRNASFFVPRRLRAVETELNRTRNVLFNVGASLGEMLGTLEEMLSCKSHRTLDAYEGLVDGLFALCCHSNSEIRTSAISVVDYAMTRFGWIFSKRIPRIISGLALQDEDMNGEFGVPSCAMLVDKLDHQGKRKRLAESIKGVCSILSLSRAVRQMLSSWKMRHKFIQTVTGTDRLMSLLPAEEMQKVVHYLQAVFSPFRASIYVLPRTLFADREHHKDCVLLVLDILSEKKVDIDGDSDSSETKNAHWRKLLLAGWFLMNFVDEEDVKDVQSSMAVSVWSICFRILENEMGQPLQRVALGLLGKLVFLGKHICDRSALEAKIATESFCKILANALVYDHKEDTSVGGGHDSQWAAGVENIIRDSSRHLAPRIIFPFQRTSQSLGSFKVTHSQLVDAILSSLSESASIEASKNLLAFGKELAAALPSEDQRNQQITSAEIFAGICGSRMRSAKDMESTWADVLLPYLDDVMSKIPFSLCGAYFDAFRYLLQFSSAKRFLPLTIWLIEKVKGTLWQPCAAFISTEKSAAQVGNDLTCVNEQGFTTQSKWLYLISAVIIEIDETETDDLLSAPAWYEPYLVASVTVETDCTNARRGESWQLITKELLPRLTEALPHPFESCRDHIARCMFRICYSHRKLSKSSASRTGGHSNIVPSISTVEEVIDPGETVVKKFKSLQADDSLLYNDRMNALSTARRFISYLVQLGESKYEFSDYVIPLLPLAFEALNSTFAEDGGGSSHVGQEESAARRALEADNIKGFRRMIAEVSLTAVISYGRPSDITRVLDTVEASSKHVFCWQARHAAANFLRCFQSAHKFMFNEEQEKRTTLFVTLLLADQRREVSSAGMAALTGILAACPTDVITKLVKEYAIIAARSTSKTRKALQDAHPALIDANTEEVNVLARRQQVAVFFLCATIMAEPYETPAYVPVALAAISRHSFERNAPLNVRDTVKQCCAEYKRTHMSDNWELHRKMFSQEQLEAFEDVTSSPHYYA